MNLSIVTYCLDIADTRYLGLEGKCFEFADNYTLLRFCTNLSYCMLSNSLWFGVSFDFGGYIILRMCRLLGIVRNL